MSCSGYLNIFILLAFQFSGVIVLLALLMASFVFLVRRYMKKKKAVKLAMSAKVGKAVQSGRSKTPQAAKSKAMKPRAAEDPEEPGQCTF